MPSDMNRPSQKIQRVALISPPGILIEAFKTQIEQIAQLYNTTTTNNNKLVNNNNKNVSSRIHIIVTNHVPPYGYGKTDGLTKIIRQISNPIYYK
jgi:hypothetical protein